MTEQIKGGPLGRLGRHSGIECGGDFVLNTMCYW